MIKNAKNLLDEYFFFKHHFDLVKNLPVDVKDALILIAELGRFIKKEEERLDKLIKII